MISICFSGKNNSLVLLKSIRLRVLAELPHIQHTAFSQQIGQDALQDHDLFFNIYIVSQRDPRIAGFLTLVNRIIWQKPHNCGFFYVKFIKF